MSERKDGPRVLEGGVHVTVPTIHLNGSSGKKLFEDICNALGALRDARHTLQDIAPHGRDYYVQGDSAFAAARGEHEQRIERIRGIEREMEAIAEGIQDQLDERKR